MADLSGQGVKKIPKDGGWECAISLDSAKVPIVGVRRRSTMHGVALSV